MHPLGFTYEQIGDEVGVGKSTIKRDVDALGLDTRPPGTRRKYPKPTERVCELDGCDQTFTPTGVQIAAGYGRFCCLGHANKGKTYTRTAGTFETCPYCGAEFWVWDAWLNKTHRPRVTGKVFCSQRCVGRWRADKSAEVLYLMTVSAKARKEWLPKKKLAETRDPSKAASARGKTEGAEALAAAIEIITEKPNLTKRSLEEQLMIRILGREAAAAAIFTSSGGPRSTGDPAYKRARNKVRGRLDRGLRDSGVPAELSHLFG